MLSTLRAWLKANKDEAVSVTPTVELYSHGFGWYELICLQDGESFVRSLRQAKAVLYRFKTWFEEDVTTQLNAIVKEKFANFMTAKKATASVNHNQQRKHFVKNPMRPAEPHRLQRLAERVNSRFHCAA